MKKVALVILFSVLSFPAWATTYYLAPLAGGGSDSNNGTSPGSPWLTPNHAVNCGDVILAASGTYMGTNFRYGLWGNVTCPGGNNVAWLKCATFDACKMTASGTQNPMGVSASYWGVQGWEVTASAENNPCFAAFPGLATVHHIIFANNIANGCYNGGFATGASGSTGVDYIAIIGNIAYNAAQSSIACTSGIDIVEPVPLDTLPGTHLYVAGNFSWGNIDPNPCGGGAPTDGEGVTFDTLDGSGGNPAYTQQAVLDNNLIVYNGGRGFEIYLGSVNETFVRHNTFWGDGRDPNSNDPYCSEANVHNSLTVQEYFNIAATSTTKGCGSNPIYAYYIVNGNGTDNIYNNVGWAASGTYGGATTSSGFSYSSSNLFGTNPSFANATAPGAPSCGSFADVPHCMAKLIANFTPTNPAAIAYGYQAPSTMQTFDPLFPQWLCNVNLPPGLVTMGCLAQSALPASPTITGVTVK